MASFNALADGKHPLEYCSRPVLDPTKELLPLAVEKAPDGDCSRPVLGPNEGTRWRLQSPSTWMEIAVAQYLDPTKELSPDEETFTRWSFLKELFTRWSALLSFLGEL